jgi:hypothetical protein
MIMNPGDLVVPKYGTTTITEYHPWTSTRMSRETMRKMHWRWKSGDVALVVEQVYHPRTGVITDYKILIGSKFFFTPASTVKLLEGCDRAT